MDDTVNRTPADILLHSWVILDHPHDAKFKDFCSVAWVFEDLKLQASSESDKKEIDYQLDRVYSIMRNNINSHKKPVSAKKAWKYATKAQVPKRITSNSQFIKDKPDTLLGFRDKSKNPDSPCSLQDFNRTKTDSQIDFQARFRKNEFKNSGLLDNERKEREFQKLHQSSVKEPPKFQKSCNNFTTALDELHANNYDLGKKGLYKEYQPFSQKNNTEVNMRPDDQLQNEKNKFGFIKNVSIVGTAVSGTVNEGMMNKRKPFKPPLKEEPKKAGEGQISKSPLMEFAEKQGLDYSLIEAIEHEILDEKPSVTWNDIAGLDDVKKIINETIIFPYLRPDIFTGLRKPARGILLFGPPGTGKTMIGRAIASQLNSTFFSISSSSLVSKWVGESEKLIKTLFKMAAFMQPSVIFVDEIDSLLSARGDSEADVVRRIKTEFFVQIDGAKTSEDDKVLIIGTTNRPEQLDEAARRRFTKKLYIPLPDKKSRLELLKALLMKESELNVKVTIDEADLDYVVDLSKGYSCADIVNMMKEAAMSPVRDLMVKSGLNNCQDWDLNDIRPLKVVDLINSLQRVKSSVSPAEISRYREWNSQFGLFNINEE